MDRFHLWISEERLPADPKARYHELILPQMRRVKVYSDVFLVDKYTAEVHAAIERFADKYVDNPYFRFLALYSPAEPHPQEDWGRVLFDCWGRADVLIPENGSLEEQVRAYMQKAIAMGGTTTSDLIRRGKLKSSPSQKDHIGWVHQTYAPLVERVAEGIGLEVVKH